MGHNKEYYDNGNEMVKLFKELILKIKISKHIYKIK